MQTSPTTPDHPGATIKTWSMKEAAKVVGVGLPSLYTRLRERGEFTRLGLDGRNLPVPKLQREGLFIVQEHSWWDELRREYRPCPKVLATYKGIILLQEVADELAREKRQESSKRSGVSGRDHDD